MAKAASSPHDRSEVRKELGINITFKDMSPVTYFFQ
jgi:hypothetical protein